MPITPFFSEESINLEESLTSLAGALDPSTEDTIEEKTTTEVPTKVNSTEETTKETKDSNINVIVNGEPYTTPSNTEEESTIEEEAEAESQLEEDIEAITAEMHVLNTMLDCSKYCVNNRIEKLEKTASCILGYESLYPGTEGIKELATKVWNFIKNTAIKIYNYLKEVYEKYIGKKIREIIAETKAKSSVNENKTAFEQALRDSKGKYIKANEFKALITMLQNLGSDTVNSSITINMLLKNPSSIVIENGYAKTGGVNFDRLRNAAQNLQITVKNATIVNGSLADAGFKADSTMIMSLLDLVDKQMAKAVDWVKIANNMQVIAREADSMKTMDSNDPNFADKLKALTTSMGAIQNAAGSLSLATRGLWSTTEAYIKAYNKAVDGAPKEPAGEK